MIRNKNKRLCGTFGVSHDGQWSSYFTHHFICVWQAPPLLPMTWKRGLTIASKQWPFQFGWGGGCAFFSLSSAIVHFQRTFHWSFAVFLATVYAMEGPASTFKVGDSPPDVNADWRSPQEQEVYLFFHLFWGQIHNRPLKKIMSCTTGLQNYRLVWAF